MITGLGWDETELTRAGLPELLRLAGYHVPGEPYHYRHGWIPVAPYFKRPGDLQPGDVVHFRGRKHLVLGTDRPLSRRTGVFLHQIAPLISHAYPESRVKHEATAQVHAHRPKPGGGHESIAAGIGGLPPVLPEHGGKWAGAHGTVTSPPRGPELVRVPPADLHPEGDAGKVTVSGRIVTPEALRLQQAMRGGISESDRLGGGVQAQTAVVHFNDGTKGVRKRFGSGLDCNGNDKTALCDAEFLAAQVAEAIGGTGCPPVVRGRGQTVYMGWAGDNAEVAEYGPQPDLGSPRAARIGLLDVVIDNTDRHPGNYMILPDGTPVPIDNSSSFGLQGGGWPGPFRQMVQRKMNAGTPPFTAAQLQQMRQRITALQPVFVQAGHREWFDNTLRRFDRFQAGPAGSVLPEAG